MSLQVWLPLNGNLNNQGLSNATITATGVTVNTSGKIGKCYSFDGDDYITIVSDNLKALFSSSSNPYSMSCWIYLNNDETDRVIIFGNYSANPFSNWELTADEKQRLCAGGTSNYTTRNCSTAINKEVWTHIAFSYDGNNTVFYINGSRINSVSGANTLTTMSSNTFYLGSDSRSGVTRLKGRMNDFRIYDHCLSDKEVKEISKGLVLHYKLSNFGNENLISNFDTSFLSYSNGTTTLFTNQMNGGTQEIISNINGAEKCIHLHSLGGNNRQYRTLSVYAGKTYTISADYYSTNSQSPAWRGELNGGNYSWLAVNTSYTTPGKWQRLSYTYNNLTSDATIYFFIYCANGQDCYVKNIKIEEGDKSTPWLPNSTDSFYNKLGLNDSIEYDCSGYGNNGTKNNITISSDSARYVSGYVFNGSSSYINAGTGAKITDTISVNLWVKYTTWGNPISCTEGGGWNFENNGGYVSFPLYVASVGYKVAKSTKPPANLADGKWHMLTGTFDKTNVKIYIDGVLEGTTATGSTNGVGYHASNSIMIGAEAANGATPAGTYLTGNISDVRIYATALSADDVKELYQVSASIDNMGNLYAYEVVE